MPTTDASRKGSAVINLALQGGGSHGALAWGVLDRLLEEPSLRIAEVSGTSAGAMNAAVLADGFASSFLLQLPSSSSCSARLSEASSAKVRSARSCALFQRTGPRLGSLEGMATGSPVRQWLHVTSLYHEPSP